MDRNITKDVWAVLALLVLLGAVLFISMDMKTDDLEQRVAVLEDKLDSSKALLDHLLELDRVPSKRFR